MTRDRIDWTPAVEYGAQYQVDLALPILEEAEIPYVVKGQEAGIWGPAFAGPTSRGIRILVPAERADEARDLLEVEGPDADGDEGPG